jgi:hypothetical protein
MVLLFVGGLGTDAAAVPPHDFPSIGDVYHYGDVTTSRTNPLTGIQELGTYHLFSGFDDFPPIRYRRVKRVNDTTR